MAYGAWRLLYEARSGQFKLCRLWFGRDGSYYVSVPYLAKGQALLVKHTVNYDMHSMHIPFEEAIDLAGVDSDEARIKMSHHPDGFVQFSGRGVTSGRDERGEIRGFGIMSWPLTVGCRGPSFGLALHGVEYFDPANSADAGDLVFQETAIPSLPGADVLTIEGYYFPPSARRFLVRTPSGPSISIVHPSGALLTLGAILAGDECEWPGFIALEVRRDSKSEGPSPSYFLSGPTGNVRKSEAGETLADGIYCMSPRGELVPRRTVDYRPVDVYGGEDLPTQWPKP